MKPSQRKRKGLRLLSLVLLIAVCGVIVQEVLRTRELAYIYDLPAEELQQNLEEYITSSVDVSMENQVSSHQWGLTGVCKLGTFSVTSSGEYQVNVRTLLGKAKVGLQSNGGDLILLEPHEENTLPLETGTYDVYCVGRYFWGTVEVAPIIPEPAKP